MKYFRYTRLRSASRAFLRKSRENCVPCYVLQINTRTPYEERISPVKYFCGTGLCSASGAKLFSETDAETHSGTPRPRFIAYSQLRYPNVSGHHRDVELTRVPQKHFSGEILSS